MCVVQDDAPHAAAVVDCIIVMLCTTTAYGVCVVQDEALVCAVAVD